MVENNEEVKTRIKIMDHIYVPKYILLSPEEAQEVLKKYNARPEQFPYILDIDPVVRELGAKPGDLIKIIRKSQTAGETVYYRYVVKG
ncbi:MAG: DNA-directed RNA polymerase subunit H [Nitrososphaerota archaeon]|nr:DNA-directed RNA polymerase subunit H [Nitrososphaerota archaeon]